MKTTPEQRRQWREIAGAATPGPWNAAVDDECPDDVRVCYVRDGQHCEWCIALCGDVLEPSREWTPETLARWRSDAAFIAAARTAIPALLDDVAELEAECDAFKARLNPAPPAGMLLYMRSLASAGPVHIEPDGAFAGNRSDVFRIVRDEDARRYKEDYKTTARPPYVATVYSRPDAEFYSICHNHVPHLVGMLERDAAERDALRVEVERLKAVAGTFDKVCADRLADEVAVLVRRRTIDSRSPAADALLDYREPPSTEPADRMAELEAEVDRLREKVSDMRSERVRADEKHKEEIERFKAASGKRVAHMAAGWEKDEAQLRAEVEQLKAALVEARAENERLVALAARSIADDEATSAHGHERQRALCSIDAEGAGGGYATCETAKRLCTLERERDEVRAEAARMRPVYEAAKAWRRVYGPPCRIERCADVRCRMSAAVDTAISAEAEASKDKSNG